MVLLPLNVKTPRLVNKSGLLNNNLMWFSELNLRRLISEVTLSRKL